MTIEAHTSLFALFAMACAGWMLALAFYPIDGKWSRWRIAGIVLAAMFLIPPLVRLWFAGVVG